jgi:hypothetical protein
MLLPLLVVGESNRISQPSIPIDQILGWVLYADVNLEKGGGRGFDLFQPGGDI